MNRIGLLLLSLFAPLLMAAPVYRDDGSIDTRFGPLEVDESNVLLYRGRPVQPRIVGNNSLWIRDVYQINASDVALVEDDGGTACPVQLYFITLSDYGVSQTGPFGTCSEVSRVVVRGDSLSVLMPGFAGPQADRATRRMAAETTVFVYRAGVVTQVRAASR